MNTPAPSLDLPPRTLWDWYVLAWQRRTTIFGYIVLALGVLATGDVLHGNWLKYVILANGFLTAALGHYNHAMLKRNQLSQEES